MDDHIWWNISKYYSYRVSRKFNRMVNNIIYFGSLSQCESIRFYSVCLKRYTMKNNKICWYILMNLDRDYHKIPREEFHSLIEKMLAECMVHDYVCEKYINKLTDNIAKWRDEIVKEYDRLSLSE